ncbi:MAG: DUF637 domain-containing protein [Pseudomonadota bacterium]
MLATTALVAVELTRYAPAAQAQVVVDPSAPLANRPSITTTGASRPQINITRPQSGVSRNKFSEFNVTPDGLVLNNATSGTTTSLGAVSANPNLSASGPAGVILNEVTSSSPSALEGATVVAGGQADVIIANPNGLVCDGCSFEGTGTATLSTGRAIVNGADVSLSVEGGGVIVERGGLTGDGTVNIAGRHVVVDGPIVASGDLTVSGGTQFFDPATGVGREAPIAGAAQSVYAIDGTAFGAMDAGRIRILGTEAGLGVRAAGALTAADDATLQSVGALEIDDLTAADVSLSAGDAIQLTGAIAASGDVTIDAASLATTPSSTLEADGDVTATLSGAVEHYGLIEGGTVRIDAGGRFFNQGFVFSDGDVIITSGDKVENIRGRKALFEDRSVANVDGYAAAIADLAAQHQDAGSPWAGYYQDLAARAETALFREEVLTNGASIAGVDIGVLAEGDVLNSAGVLAAAQDLIVQSTGGSVINSYQETRELLDGDTACGKGETCAYTYEFHAGELIAGRDLILEAYGDVIIDGSDAAAGRDLELVALGGDVELLNPSNAVTANAYIEDFTSSADCRTYGNSDHQYRRCTDAKSKQVGWRVSEYKTTGVQRPSRIIAGEGDIYAEASEDINILAAQMSAGGDILLIAEGDVNLSSTSGALIAPANILETYTVWVTETYVANRDPVEYATRSKRVARTRVRAAEATTTLVQSCKSVVVAGDPKEYGSVCSWNTVNVEPEITVEFLNATAQLSSANIYIEGESILATGARFYSGGDLDLIARSGDLVVDASLKNYGEAEDESVDLAAELDLAAALSLHDDFNDNVFDEARFTTVRSTGKFGPIDILYQQEDDGSLTLVPTDWREQISEQKQRALAFLRGSDLLLATDHLGRMAPGGDLPLQNLFDAAKAVGLQGATALGGDDTGAAAEYGSEIRGFDSLATALSQRGDLAELGAEQPSYEPTDAFLERAQRDYMLFNLASALPQFEDSLLWAGDDLTLSAGGTLSLAGGTQAIISGDAALSGERIDVLSVDDTGVGVVSEFDEATANIDDDVIAGQHWDPVAEEWTELDVIQLPDIDPVALLVGGDLSILATDGFQNYGGRFEADGALDIFVGDILLNAGLSEEFELTKEHGCVGKACGTLGVRFATPSLTGGTSTVINAGGDVVNRGGVIQSGGALSLIAGGSFINEALSDKYVLVDYKRSKKSGGFFSKKKTVVRKFEEAPVIAPGVVEADGGFANLLIGGHFVNDGSFVSAAGDLTVAVAGSAELRARAVETAYVDYKKSSRSLFGFSLSLNLDSAEWNQFHNTYATLQGDTIELGVGGDLFVTGGELIAQNDLSIETGGDIFITPLEQETYERIEIRDSGIFSDKRYSSNRQKLEINRSELASGADLTLRSLSGDISITAGALTADADLTIEALEGEIALLAGVEKELFESETYSANLVWFKNVQEGFYREDPVHTHLLAGGKLELRAANGLIVEYRGDESLDESIRKLSQVPELAWMMELRARHDVDWRAIEPILEEWRHEQEGLTPAGAALIAIVVTAITYGAASQLGFSAASALGQTTVASAVGPTLPTLTTAGAITKAAVTAGVTNLASQASIAVVNNKGDIGAALDDLGSSSTIRSLVTSIVSAGVVAGLTDIGVVQAGDQAAQASTISDLGQEILDQAILNTTKAAISLAVEGGDAEDIFAAAAINSVVTAIGAYAAAEIGAAYNNGNGDLPYAARLVAHTALGCALGAASQGSEGCVGGGAGAFTGTLTADLYQELVLDIEALEASGRSPEEMAAFFDRWRDVGVDITRLAGALTALGLGADPNTGAYTAGNVADNNILPAIVLIVKGGLIAWTAYEVYQFAQDAEAFIEKVNNGHYEGDDGYDQLRADAIALGGDAFANIVLGKVTKTAGAVFKASDFAVDIGEALYEAGRKVGLDADDLAKLKGAARRTDCPSSFHGDTLVQARRGFVPIRDITAGEYQVWARDEMTGRMGWKPVLAKSVAQYRETVYTTIRDVETGALQVIRSDREHPYFAQRLEGVSDLHEVAYAPPPPSSHGHVYRGPIAGGAWVDAQNLRPGDRLINADGSWAEILSSRIEQENLTAYNLSVQDYETFFVAETGWDDAVWVHNCAPSLPRQIPDPVKNKAAEIIARQDTIRSGDTIDFGDGTLTFQVTKNYELEELEFALDAARTGKNVRILGGDKNPGLDLEIDGVRFELRHITKNRVTTALTAINDKINSSTRTNETQMVFDGRGANLSGGHARKALELALRDRKVSEISDITIYTSNGVVTLRGGKVR